MGYNNNNYGNDGYNQNQGYNNGGYNQGQQRPRKKRTGAKSGLDKNGNPFVRGWRATKQWGLITYLATPYKGTRVHASKSGRQWHNWVVKVSFSNGQSILKSGLYDPQSRKVIIAELGLVINPSASNGGYCGTFIKKN